MAKSASKVLKKPGAAPSKHAKCEKESLEVDECVEEEEETRTKQVLKRPMAAMQKPSKHVKCEKETLEVDECVEEGEEEEEEVDEEVEEESEVLIKCLITHAKSGVIRAYVQGKFAPSNRKRLLIEFTKNKAGSWNPLPLLVDFFSIQKIRLQYLI